MFKLLKQLKLKEWLLVLVLVVFVVAQVFFDIQLAVYTKNIMEEMQNLNSTTASILRVGGTMLLFALGSAACTLTVGLIAAYISSMLAYRLRDQFYRTVQSFSAAEIDKFSTAGLITRCTNDIQRVQNAVLMFLRIAVSAPITAVWAIIKIQGTSVPLTIVAGAWILFMVAALGGIFLIVFPRFGEMQKLTDKMNSVMRENLTGLRVVRAYNAESYQEDKFEKVNDRLMKVNLFASRWSGIMGPLMMLVFNGITLTIYWYGAELINTSSGTFGIADLMSFVNLAMQVLMSFMMLTMLFAMLPRAEVSAKRINEVLATPLTILDKEQTTPIMREKEGQIVFENVSFKYPGADGYVLENINFSVEKGQTLAIIGATGSGKSTLINLIPRLFDATEGNVLVSGVNVKDMSQTELHSEIGYVPQKGVLFSGTIAENIAFGGNNDKDSIQRSAQIACADGFIEEKEDGYSSAISQGGKNVSGGQKQRLSIARAVNVNPKILIFDDSFSALDYKTDRQVRENLKKSTAETTKVIVAQRIGTIMDADRILVLSKGKIIGDGKHSELLNTCDEYREIALSQLTKEELGL